MHGELKTDNFGADIDPETGNFITKEEPNNPSPLDTEKYNTEPLPFYAVLNQEAKLTWQDFDQTDDGRSILLYRGASGGFRQGSEALSSAASSGKSEQNIFSDIGTDNVHQIVDASSAATGFFGVDPTLHTTRDKKMAAGFAEANMASSTGEIVTYKVPKEWLIQNKDKVIIGHQEEKEINFFYALPADFIFKSESVQDVANELGITQIENDMSDNLPKTININI